MIVRKLYRFIESKFPMTSQKELFAWWQTGVVYQIYPRSFQDSNADGIGDLQGIINRLDYLNDGTPNSLGIDAIWISPCYPSPMADFGYDVANYVDIHPMFGDLETFDRLVEEAHKRNIRIILDLVPNHSSDEHPWFLESRSSKDNPKRDWYIWQDPKPDGSPPNNWGSVFGGPAWQWDEKTRQYYLHLFVKEQPDLNWRNPDLYDAMMDVCCFWLDRGVDGFRIDVIGFMVKDEQLRDNPLNPDAGNLHPDDIWSSQHHVYDVDQPGVHDVIRDFRAIADSYSGDRVTIGEVWFEPRERWTRYYGDGEKLDGVHMPFNFDLMHKPWDAAVVRASVEELEAALPPGAWPNYVLSNHDRPRLASRYGKEAVRTAAMLLLTLRGTPTLYLGDEIGMADGAVPPDRIQDPQGINLGADRSRDYCRTPMQWSADLNAGFSPVDPWLPVDDSHKQVNVSAQLDDPKSVLTLYRRLMHYRKATPALDRGSYTTVAVTKKNCFVYLREYDGERCLCRFLKVFAER
jgi:alpha-glucosidase